jgi:uncharacterized protein YdeI (YjbR/CyaY-like superfamily)
LKAKKQYAKTLGGDPAEPRFFSSTDAFRRWLGHHHARASELWIGFYRKGAGTKSLDYLEAVEVALCFGWIDGIRKKRDDTTYVNRFTPRKPTSVWSRINIDRVERLIAAGLMQPAGLAAYEKRDARKSGIYSFEQRPERLTPALERRFRAEPKAWEHFSAQPPGYKRLGMWWILSAKREETQLRRLQQLIDAHGHGVRVGVLFGQTGTVPATAKRPKALTSQTPRPKRHRLQDPKTSRPQDPKNSRSRR